MEAAATQAAAQADLDAFRQCTSRVEMAFSMASVLESQCTTKIRDDGESDNVDKDHRGRSSKTLSELGKAMKEAELVAHLDISRSQADLDAARQCTSRLEMCSTLTSLRLNARQARISIRST